MPEVIHLRPPAVWKQTLEGIRVREVAPWDICLEEDLDSLYRIFPGLAGDNLSFDESYCQSWRRNWGWWREFVDTE